MRSAQRPKAYLQEILDDLARRNIIQTFEGPDTFRLSDVALTTLARYEDGRQLNLFGAS